MYYILDQERGNKTEQINGSSGNVFLVAESELSTFHPKFP